MKLQYVIQPWRSEQYVQLFHRAFAAGTYAEFYAAVAYATTGGVRILEEVLRDGFGEQWPEIRKRWLVGIDWCRTDPPALDRLAAFPHSSLRAPNAHFLLSRQGCRAETPYHPKVFILRVEETSAIICGSGNLSVSGLTRSCECGSLLLIDHSVPDDAGVPRELDRLLAWFEDAWRGASPLDADVAVRYRKRCRSLVKQGVAAPTEDDAPPPQPARRGRRRGLSEKQIHALHTFDHLWIEAGTLGSNLSRGIPGNQLGMTPYTRVFFGTPVSDVQPNTEVDRITLIWDGQEYADRTLKFGHNGMDILNVPPTGERGLLYYEGKTLLFTRRSDGTFEFTVGSESEKRRWRAKSARARLAYRMSGKDQRQWGVF